MPLPTYSQIPTPYNKYLERDPNAINIVGSASVDGGTGGNVAYEDISLSNNIYESPYLLNDPDQLAPGTIQGAHLTDLTIETFIKSAGYIAGSAGFKIDGLSGNAEFNNVNIRGNLYGGKTSYTDNTAGFFIGSDGGIYKVYVGTAASNFKWDGVNLSITGGINATSGSIGGFNIGTDYIRDVADSFGLASTVTGGDDVRFWAGASFATRSSAPFRITESGVIAASSGTVGGCTLATTSIGSTTFVSGPLGSGWNISNTGVAEFQNVTVRGIIRTSVFEKDTISAVNGIVLVSSADVLSADMTALDSSTVTISSQTTFFANEIIRMKDGTDDEWILVTNAASAPVYTVTRDLAGSYVANNNPIWKKGTAVVSMGRGAGTLTGYILLDSSSAYSPYMDVYGRNSTTYSDTTLHARIGWLKGITDASVGLASTDVWGIYTDNAYIKGVIVATSGKLGGWTMNATNIYNGTTEATALISLDSVTPKIRIGVASGAQRTELRSGGVYGYAANGTSIVWQFLNVATTNNIMQINKVDNTPAYGNAFMVFDSSTDTDAAFEIKGTGAGNITSKTLLLVDSSFTNATAIAVIRADAGTKGTILLVENNVGAVTIVGNFRNAATTGNALHVGQEHASNAATNAVFDNAGTGSNLYISNTGNGIGVEIVNNAATTKQSLAIGAVATTTAMVIECTNADALTTGSMIYMKSNSADIGTRSIAKLINDNAAAVNCSVVYLQQDSTASAIYIAKAASASCIEMVQTANDANDTIGIKMNLANAGAGVEYAFAFAGSEKDADIGAGTRAGRVKVLMDGVTKYIHIYT